MIWGALSLCLGRWLQHTAAWELLPTGRYTSTLSHAVSESSPTGHEFHPPSPQHIKKKKDLNQCGMKTGFISAWGSGESDAETVTVSLFELGSFFLNRVPSWNTTLRTCPERNLHHPVEEIVAVPPVCCYSEQQRGRTGSTRKRRSRGVNLPPPPFTPVVPTQVRGRFKVNHNLRLVSGRRAPSVRRAEESPSRPVASNFRGKAADGVPDREEFSAGNWSRSKAHRGRREGTWVSPCWRQRPYLFVGRVRGKRGSAKTNRRARTR